MGGGGTGGTGGGGGSAELGACENEDDLMVLAGLSDPSEARRISGVCGQTWCGGTESFCVSNATTCVENFIPGLSSECASCYARLAWCAGILCNPTCASNACGACLTLTNCNGGTYAQCQQQLNECAGRLPPECLPS
jgi:hypothetical protein